MTKDHSRVKRQSRVLVCGSLPDGDASSFFDTWPQNQELWLDTVDLRWFACQPTVLKINRSELQTLSQLLSTKSFGSKDLNNPFSTDLNSKDSSPEAQCSALASEFGFEVIIVTDEQRSVSLWEGQSWTNFKPPHVKGLKNSIGAGDTFFAACAVARDHGRSWAEACTFACHVASQRCRFDLIEQLPNFRP
jgi:sugar/nucleoside kinase (ribokinase family)